MRSKSHPQSTIKSLPQVLALALFTLVALAASFVPVGTKIAEAQSDPKIVDTYVLAIHGNGSQMEIHEIELHDDQTRVNFDLVNGRDFATQFNATERDTRIEDDQGRSYQLVSGFQASLEPGRTATVSLVFDPMPRDSDTLSLYFRDRGRGDDTNDVSEGFPSFVIEDIDLTQEIEEPALPEDFQPEESQTHPNRVSFEILTVEFESTFTRVSFEARNPTSRRVTLSNGRHASYIEDNLGNRYYMKLQDDEAFLRLNAERRFDGSLGFAGRIHPDATSFEVIMNGDESLTDDETFTPKFVLGPWELTEGAGAEILPIDIDEVQTHPNETRLTVERIEFDGELSMVDIDIDNRGDGLVFLNSCCENSYLLDDLGNRYFIVRPDSNGSLEVQEGNSLGGTVRFTGEIDPDATEITIVFNDRGQDNQDDEFTLNPTFRFGPFELERSDASANSVEDILETFDAEAGRRTVTLTIPDLDEGETFEDLLQVLDLYEGENMRVIANTDSQADELADALADSGIDADLIEANSDGEEPADKSPERQVTIIIFTRDGLPD